MKKLLIYTVGFIMSFYFMTAADFAAYKVYDSDGDEQDIEDLFEDAAESDIVFFGELHNNPVCHWLQLKLAEYLHEQKKEKLVFGAEMFESDDQIKIDEYFAGWISQSNFEKECRLWNNYKTDYKPVLEFANENKIHFVATNIPRRYASLVSKEGFDGLEKLSDEAKSFIAPLPIHVDLTLPGYAKMDEMMGGGHSAAPEKKEEEVEVDTMDAIKPDTADIKKMYDADAMEKAPSENPKMKKMMEAMAKMKDAQKGDSTQIKGMDMMSKLTYFKQAQASKDATMGHFIMQNYKPGYTFYHLNGSYHSNNFEGIVWFVKKADPNLKVFTIATVLSEDMCKFSKENLNLADYIIVIPADMTTTY